MSSVLRTPGSLPALLLLAASALFLPSSATATQAAEMEPRHLVLVTLDTTRADALGLYGGDARTPTLDALARRGVHWRRALAPAPLTLPSHATLMTGRTPPAHGVRDNATDALDATIPTLAETLSKRGFHTVAVVASRVLDRRFGLDRGFDVYDDRMPAEERGEYGYPERRADAVVDAALAHLAGRPADRPVFLWAHLYDPHAPYAAPGSATGSILQRYQEEIEFCDRQLARLFDALPAHTLIAVVADHGEMLGEHGEDTHGLFLYDASLRVPMIVAGLGVPTNQTVDETVAARRLGHSLLRLLTFESPLPGPALPGLGLSPETVDSETVYSESLLPASAYGWSSLHAVTDGRHRFILAPRPELYDLESDPAEAQNLVDARGDVARRMRALVEDELAGAVDRRDAPLDQETRDQLEALGYLSGSSSAEPTADAIDPKDGLALLTQFAKAKELRQLGQIDRAIQLFEELLKQNPDNGPVRTRLAEALLAAGRRDESLALYRQAAERRPDFEFARFQLASALLNQGRFDEGRAELERVLAIDSRFSDAWLTLAELAHRRGDSDEELHILEAAIDAGTVSAGLFLRLGMRLSSGKAADPSRAAELLRRATETTPGWSMPWLIRGKVLLQQGRAEEAGASLREAARLAAPNSAEAAEARRLLAELKRVSSPENQPPS